MRGNNPAITKLSVLIAIVERGQQLAQREVAGAAEHHEVERVHGDDPDGHGWLSLEGMA